MQKVMLTLDKAKASSHDLVKIKGGLTRFSELQRLQSRFFFASERTESGKRSGKKLTKRIMGILSC